jgi:hypothetical protein
MGTLSLSSFPANFFTVGTHTSNEGTLTITDVPSVAETPEPSSLAFLGTGVLRVAGMIRRRLT